MSPWYGSVMRPIPAADDSTVSTQGANKSADIPGEGAEKISELKRARAIAQSGARVSKCGGPPQNKPSAPTLHLFKVPEHPCRSAESGMASTKKGLERRRTRQEATVWHALSPSNCSLPACVLPPGGKIQMPRLTPCLGQVG